jgi:hypothetical protein
MPWTFYDYRNASGRNLIKDWVEGLPQGTRHHLKARLNALINELRFVDALDRSNGVGQLHGECAGLFELVLKVDKTQFRPIGCYGPAKTGEFTLLAGAIEKDGKFTEPSICVTARERASRIHDRKHVCLHDFT